MKHIFEQMSLGLLCVTLCLASISAFATPTISDVKVASVEPLGVAIDYTVSGATEEDAGLPLCVTLSVGDDSIGALNLAGATNCVNGAHRIYWNMAAEGIAFAPTIASVTVAYLPNPKYCIVNLAGGSATNAYPVAYMDAEPKSGFNKNEYKTTKLVLKRVDAGSYKMQGSSTVKLTRSFYMGLYEVTQKQWHLVTGANPCSSTSYGRGDSYPVHYVSYNAIRGSSDGAKWPVTNSVDSTSFLGKLRDRTKQDFDLPTEAQWEYTCRAGTTTTYSYGSSVKGDYMWYTDNSSSETHEVGTKKANPWGFYDMHGNVWEWCLDWYDTLSYGTDPKGKGSSSGSLRVGRGGYWGSNAPYCSSSYRFYDYPSNGSYSGGFRLSRTLPADADAASVTVEFALERIYADGSSVDGKMSLGYAPTETRNAVVAVNDELQKDASEAG